MRLTHLLLITRIPTSEIPSIQKPVRGFVHVFHFMLLICKTMRPVMMRKIEPALLVSPLSELIVICKEGSSEACCSHRMRSSRALVEDDILCQGSEISQLIALHSELSNFIFFFFALVKANFITHSNFHILYI